MKQYVLIVIFTSIAFNTFCQEKSKGRAFVNPQESNPKFKEDIKLSESDNLKSFHFRLLKHLSSNFKSEIAYKQNAILVIIITEDGNAKFDKIKVAGNHSKIDDDFSNEVRRRINLLPKFIPAKQRNHPVNVKYIIPINTKYFPNK